MQLKVFSIPVVNPGDMEEEANRFLRAHRVMTIDRQFTAEGGGYWTVFVTYQEGTNAAAGASVRSGKIDYREVLSPEEFGRFAHYRDIRKELAAQQRIPAYAVFTDEELSQIARMNEVTIEKIAAIKNIDMAEAWQRDR